VPPRLALALVTLTACALAAVVGVVLAGAGGTREEPASPTGWEGALRPPEARAPDFTLTDQDGRRVTMDAYRGQPFVMTFVYSTCEDTCPAQVQAIRGALDDLGRDVPVLGVSVDPANDTPARARRFVNEQRMTGRMQFLLGDEAALRPVWSGFGIRPQRAQLDHSAYVVLVDGAGRQRVGFPFSALTEEGLVHDLRRLLPA
jgi:protein SCO1/2